MYNGYVGESMKLKTKPIIGYKLPETIKWTYCEDEPPKGIKPVLVAVKWHNYGDIEVLISNSCSTEVWPPLYIHRGFDLNHTCLA